MITIREAKPADAPATLVFMKTLLAEPDVYMLRTADEFNLSVRQEEAVLRDFHESPNSIFIVAEVDGQMVGMADLRGGRYQADRHCAELSILVAKAWRGKGVGSQMIEYLLQWAKENPVLKRVFLFVAAPNEGAVRLYERCGFLKEGHMPGDYHRNGQYYDSYIMGMWLDNSF